MKFYSQKRTEITKEEFFRKLDWYTKTYGNGYFECVDCKYTLLDPSTIVNVRKNNDWTKQSNND